MIFKLSKHNFKKQILSVFTIFQKITHPNEPSYPIKEMES